MIKSLSLFAFIFLLAACSSSKKIAKESSIGVLSYLNYDLKTARTNTVDTDYYVITSQREFGNTFKVARTIDVNAPNFAGQTLVAIATPASTKLRVIRAAIASGDLNVYAGRCENMEAGCPENGLTVATVPKSLSVKWVNFYVDGSLVKKMPVFY